MILQKMQINHAFRHFTPDEMMTYFRYNERYIESMTPGTPYSKSFMTDGAAVYFVFFDTDDNIMDQLKIADLKYIDPHEIQGKALMLN